MVPKIVADVVTTTLAVVPVGTSADTIAAPPPFTFSTTWMVAVIDPLITTLVKLELKRRASSAMVMIIRRVVKPAVVPIFIFVKVAVLVELEKIPVCS